MNTRSFNRPARGAAALAVSMVLLFAMSLVVFFVNRSMIFEQRTSANQYRATKAFEMAEAGIEWAQARLNESINIANSPACTTGAGAETFRERYLAPDATGFHPVTVSPPRPGCSIDSAGVATCSCPASGTAPVLGASTDPRFTVQFIPTSDLTSVELVSYGCTGGSTCEPSASGLQEAEAVVRVLLKVVPRFPNSPGAGLITGSAAVTGGNLNVINTDVKSNGITINSGSVVEMGTGTTVTTLPGTPPRASVLDNDPSLATLTSSDNNGEAFFRSFFGVGFTDYKQSPQTWYLTSGSCSSTANPSRCTSCGSAAACGTALSTAYDLGSTQFWSDTDVSFTNANLPTAGTLGTAEKPLIFAGDGNVELKSNLTAYGMFYVASATASENWDYSGSGSAKVFGAFISRGDFNKGSGTLDLIYDASVFGTGDISGLLVKVPGSWRDKLTTY
jgi:hypothetical protein